MSQDLSSGTGAEPEARLSTVFLSQRDLGLQIPINFVTDPGISISAACFSHLRFEENDFRDCFSNLIAVGFRNFALDLYWDDGRRKWSFCPVAIPNLFSPMGSIPSSLSLGAARNTALPVSDGSSLNARQESVTGSSLSGSPSSASSTSTIGEPQPTFSPKPDTPNPSIISLGPHRCTASTNVELFTAQLINHISQSQNTLGAHLIYVYLNVHAAASRLSPSSPAPQPSSLPSPSELLGTVFSGNLSAFLYTPSDLSSNRANLNSSWYMVSERDRPVDGYYGTSTNQYGIVSTEDGWPSESYIEFVRNKRLLLNWGFVDPQMQGYNFSGDASTIFASGYLRNIKRDLVVTNEGDVTQGCFVRNGTNEASQINSSWAIGTTITGFDYPVSPRSNIQPLLTLTQNLTACGISPFLNTTLLNTTAHNNPTPYHLFTTNTIWSWSPDAPLNGSITTTASPPSATPKPDSNPDPLHRCASTSPLTGLWTVSDCSDRYPAACRAKTQPYNWTTTTYEISYSYASAACPDDYEFAAPRTALENSYLTQRIRDGGKIGNSDGDGEDGMREGRVWVDFNSLDIQGCWVTGGPDVRCPYSNAALDGDDLARRTILVPTIAALVVLIITALTVFVKCAGNRKVRKRTRNRTRRADNGFVYEGVPS